MAQQKAGIIAFFASLAGVRADAQRLTPDSLSSAATLGLIMTSLSIVSSLTAGYALSRAFVGSAVAPFIAILGGIIWGISVFAIDRLMILGMDKFSTGGRRFMQVALRLPFAIVVSLVMSKPLILRLAATEINAELYREGQGALTQEMKVNGERLGVEAMRESINELHDEEANLQKRLNGEPDSARYREAVSQSSRTLASYERAKLTADPKLVALKAQMRSLEAQPSSAASLRHLQSLQENAKALRAEVDEVRLRAAKEKDLVDSERKEWYRQQHERLEEAHQSLVRERQTDEVARQRLLVRNDRSEVAIASNEIPDLVNQYRVLRKITGDPKHPDHNAMSSFEMAIDFLFLLLELTPLITKATSKIGPLDEAIRNLDGLDTETIRLNRNMSDSVREMGAQAVLQVMDAYLEKWKQIKLDMANTGPMSVRIIGDLRRESDELVRVSSRPEEIIEGCATPLHLSGDGIADDEAKDAHAMPPNSSEDVIADVEIEDESHGLYAAA